MLLRILMLAAALFGGGSFAEAKAADSVLIRNVTVLTMRAGEDVLQDRDVLVAFERGGGAWETTPTEIGDVAAPRGLVIATAMPEARIDALATFIHERYRQ